MTSRLLVDEPILPDRAAWQRGQKAPGHRSVFSWSALLGGGALLPVRCNHRLNAAAGFELLYVVRVAQVAVGQCRLVGSADAADQQVTGDLAQSDLIGARQSLEQPL